MIRGHPRSDVVKADGTFVVCVHDVCPLSFPQVLHILNCLQPLVGKTVSLAIIPEPGGRSWPADAHTAAMTKGIRDHAYEVLLHGLTHQRPRAGSPLSWFIGRNDEFAVLSDDEALRRIRRGQAVLSELLDRQVAGFIPPGWRAGVLSSILSAAGLEYLVQISRIVMRDGTTLRLATWSWDAGPVVPAGAAMELIGNALSVRGGAVPVIAVHPADVTRGFLPRATRRIERLLAGGRRPTGFGELVAGARTVVESASARGGTA